MTDTTELLAQLSAGITELTTSQRWESYLATQAKFHNYSAGNVMLIAMQDPYATQVAGYKTWQSLGRQVRKGETSLRILAPLAVRDKETGETDIKGFRSVGVFDIAQTDGDDLPEVVDKLTGAAPGEMFARLASIAVDLGFSVEVGEIEDPDTNGYCDFLARKILVRGANDPAQRVKTLAHEICHAILHDPENRPAGMSRGLVELEAESGAYVICASLGLETDAYSFGYVATWAGDADKALKAIKASQARIHQASEKVLKAYAAASDVESIREGELIEA